jgi:hypothetical protein
VFIVAADLERKVICPGRYQLGREGVMLGPESKRVCNRALERARVEKKLGHDVILVVTAGVAPEKWDYVTMSNLMHDYLRSKSEEFVILVKWADEFTTWGEMEALADCLLYNAILHNVRGLILTVRWWHAPRALFLCMYRLLKRRVKSVRPTVQMCPSNACKKAIAKEFVGAWPKNIFRVLIGR